MRDRSSYDDGLAIRPLLGRPSRNDANEFAMWIVDLQSASVSPEPYRGITPGPWQPSGSLMLGLSDVCVANGFAPVFIEAASGQMWRVESAQNIWYQAWSSDGASALSGSHATLYRLAPRSETAELLLSFDTLRDDTDDVPRSLTWSATGRWITGDAESGRGRC